MTDSQRQNGNAPAEVSRGTNDLPWTGERLVTSLSGQIVFEHLHRYAIACVLAEGKDVLDIACGEGYGSALLGSRARSVIGVDADDRAVQHANGKYGRQRRGAISPGDL